MNVLGKKAAQCLRIARLRHSGCAELADKMYRDACEEWSEKAMIRKFEDLVARGYIECGVSARTGWLTDKGKAALEADTTWKLPASS